MNHITNVHHDQTIDDKKQAPPSLTVQEQSILHILEPTLRRVMGTVPPAESPLFLVHEKMWNVFQSVPIEERLRQVRCFIIHMKIPRAIMHRICRLPSRDESRDVSFVEFRDFLEGKKRMKECHEAKVFTTYLNMKYSPKAVVAYVKKFKYDAHYFRNFEEGVPQNAKCPSEGVLGASCTCHHSYVKVKKIV